jgi:hypothetical protein
VLDPHATAIAAKLAAIASNRGNTIRSDGPERSSSRSLVWEDRGAALSSVRSSRTTAAGPDAASLHARPRNGGPVRLHQLNEKPKLATDHLRADCVNDSAMAADHDALADHERILVLHVTGRENLVASPQLVRISGHISSTNSAAGMVRALYWRATQVSVHWPRCASSGEFGPLWLVGSEVDELG